MAKLDAKHPPTHVTVAACDLLKIQGLAYAQHLRSAGVSVIEEVLPGVPHGFTFPVNAEVTKAWLERQTDAFAAAFADESS
jgi:acetyl esterase/lipase